MANARERDGEKGEVEAMVVPVAVNVFRVVRRVMVRTMQPLRVMNSAIVQGSEKRCYFL